MSMSGGNCPGGTSFHKSNDCNSFVDMTARFVGDSDSMKAYAAAISLEYVDVLSMCRW
ncbi:MAG: hypothetical protein IKR13_06890 [Victivallales bacterium]|nr:hypothetical protein [Victivallales bacterium]